jgi:cytochrome c556
MSQMSSDELNSAAQRFEASLVRLEAALEASVSQIEAGAGGADADVAPLLRDELAAARARSATLQDAVDHARHALDAAIEDIREALGPI